MRYLALLAILLISCTKPPAEPIHSLTPESPRSSLEEVFVSGYYISALSKDKSVLSIGHSKSGPLNGVRFSCSSEILTSIRDDKVLEVTCK